MYPVGVDSAKSWVYSVLNEEEPRVHFPLVDFCDATFFSQLCSEKRSVEANQQDTTKPSRARAPSHRETYTGSQGQQRPRG